MAAMERQLATYDALAAAVEATGDAAARSALEAFEPELFANLTLALDRRFVHRLRGVAGKDGNPLNETEILVTSLMDNDGVLRDINVIKYVPGQAVLKIAPGDRIVVTADGFKALSRAFLATIAEKFL
jgi:hypothetical protein